MHARAHRHIVCCETLRTCQCRSHFHSNLFGNKVTVIAWRSVTGDSWILWLWASNALNSSWWLGVQPFCFLSELTLKQFQSINLGTIAAEQNSPSAHVEFLQSGCIAATTLRRGQLAHGDSSGHFPQNMSVLRSPCSKVLDGLFHLGSMCLRRLQRSSSSCPGFPWGISG